MSSPTTAAPVRSMREYVALVLGRFRRARGHGRRAARPPSPSSRENGGRPEARGRLAVTHWRVEEAFAAATLVACRLETGRTHQIRVHLAHIGHPLLGDSVYGAGFKTKANLLAAQAQKRSPNSTGKRCTRPF